MVDKMSLTVYKCPQCGGECEKYDDDLYRCMSCGALVADPIDKKVIEIRNRDKIERIRFEIRQYNDKMAEKEKEEELLKAYARLSWLGKLKFHLSLTMEEIWDSFTLFPFRNTIVCAIIITAIVLIIKLVR